MLCDPVDYSLPGSSLSIRFSRQEYWSGLLCLLQVIFLTQGSNWHLVGLLHWRAGSSPLVPPGKQTELRGKESACQCRRCRFNPGSGRSPGEGNGKPLQYFCLENPMDRGAWWAIVFKSQTQLRDWTTTKQRRAGIVIKKFLWYFTQHNEDDLGLVKFRKTTDIF